MSERLSIDGWLVAEADLEHGGALLARRNGYQAVVLVRVDCG